MNAEIGIPEAVHICPGCEEICSGLEYCASCRLHIEATANFHAMRASQLFSALRRETGVMPESRKLNHAQRVALLGFVRAGIIVVGLAFWLWIAVDIVTKGRGL